MIKSQANTALCKMLKSSFFSFCCPALELLLLISKTCLNSENLRVLVSRICPAKHLYQQCLRGSLEILVGRTHQSDSIPGQRGLWSWVGRWPTPHPSGQAGGSRVTSAITTETPPLQGLLQSVLLILPQTSCSELWTLMWTEDESKQWAGWWRAPGPVMSRVLFYWTLLARCQLGGFCNLVLKGFNVNLAMELSHLRVGLARGAWIFIYTC